MQCRFVLGFDKLVKGFFMFTCDYNNSIDSQC